MIPFFYFMAETDFHRNAMEQSESKHVWSLFASNFVCCSIGYAKNSNEHGSDCITPEIHFNFKDAASVYL